ncbi:formyl transferase [Aestuariivirga litoralis]|uniref:formyl transferase n=1 Tax=Aestuariivirga litoralis TaxID=2650924 RepID=UPI0018C5860B|nr:formyl transferase [Aestuariivirga litoralis]
MNNSLLMLGTDKSTTWIVYNDLVSRFGPFPILIEDGVSKRNLIKLRMKRIGVMPVVSQLAFVALIRPVLRLMSAKRLNYLSRLHGLESTPPVSDFIHRVSSVNGDECRVLLQKYRPEVVVVNGTRIIGKKTLGSVKTTFINTHQGITPRYRGAHGAYWALAENRRTECGVTVHLVDAGIDTGNIITQVPIEPGPEDNFITYPLLQTAAALEHVANAVKAVWKKQVKSHPITDDGLVWYHPGFFQYIRGALRGVW